MKIHKGLFHLNRQKRVKSEHIEDADIFYQLQKRTAQNTWDAAIRIVDKAIDGLDGADIDWAQLASLFGHKGSVSIKDGELVWRMADQAAKAHDVLTKKMLGVFLMWRFSARDGWFAYIKDTGIYDKFSEKEITVTCYFRKK